MVQVVSAENLTMQSLPTTEIVTALGLLTV